MERILDVRDVTLDLTTRDREVRVLDDVSFSLARGERVALLGASGSGKSTLIRVIGGLQALRRRGSGEIRLGDELLQDTAGPGPRARQLRRRIGVVFQQFQLAPRLELFTNVLVGALAREPLWRRCTQQFSPEERARAMCALEQVGLAAHVHQRTSTLSGGQQQRAAIARTLVQDGELVLADEPVASLDPETARQVLELMVALQLERGTTLLVSLHQLELARTYFERAIALCRGQVVFDGPTSRLDEVALDRIYRATALS